MALTGLAGVYSATKDLIPHIEEAALKYVFRQYAMASRVTVFSDMAGFNVRKLSQYLPPARAVELLEDTAIPDKTIQRVRKVDIEPKEVGVRYRLSDRRITTDLEPIVSDTVEALGKGIGDKVEADLMQAGLSTFRGGTIGAGVATDFSLTQFIQAYTIFRARGFMGVNFAVTHPYQVLPEMEKLIDYSGADAQAALDFRNVAIRSLASYNLPTFGMTNLTVGDFLPRNVKWRVLVTSGTPGGTFRLQVGPDYVVGENITGAVTVSATPATTASNLQTALNALTMTSYYSGSGTWTVADGGGGNVDLEVTPPSDLFLEDDSQLRVAIEYTDANATLPGPDPTVILKKSKYDLVADPNGPTDMDGVATGVHMEEMSGSAKMLFFQRPALVYDLRQAIEGGRELVNQNRTIEFFANTKYGVGQWNPEYGMFIHTKATAPHAVA